LEQVTEIDRDFHPIDKFEGNEELLDVTASVKMLRKVRCVLSEVCGFSKGDAILD
jgi:hypothetical protein